MRGKGKVFWNLGFFSLFYSDLIGDKLNFFFPPQVQSVLSMTIIGEWSLPVLISTHEPFIIFSLPSLRRWSDRVALLGTRHLFRLKSNRHLYYWCLLFYLKFFCLLQDAVIQISHTRDIYCFLKGDVLFFTHFYGKHGLYQILSLPLLIYQ